MLPGDNDSCSLFQENKTVIIKNQKSYPLTSMTFLENRTCSVYYWPHFPLTFLKRINVQ